MTPSLDSERGPSADVSLADAAARLGCHVETLRLRIRQGRLDARRGPHGRYYVTEEELSFLLPPRRMKRQPPDPALLEVVTRDIDELLGGRGRLTGWQRALLEMVRADPKADRHLYRALAATSLLLARLNTLETAVLMGISVRQVRRLRRQTLSAAFHGALRRQHRAEQGRLRRAAKPIVTEIQTQLRVVGFEPARRDPRSGVSGARAGTTARIALVRNLNPDQRRDLQLAGLSASQVAAISLIGIGADELQELILNGLPQRPATAPIPSPSHDPMGHPGPPAAVAS